MQKKYRTIFSLSVVMVTVSFIALTLHFLSLKTDFQELADSYQKLNDEYHQLLQENEEFYLQRIEMSDQLSKAATLIEQSEMEKEKLKKKSDILQEEILKYKKMLEVPQLSTNQSPSRGQQVGDWSYYRLTYYDANFQSTGKNPGDPLYGITRSGRPVEEGVTIAVDPDIIPLGSWVLLRWPDGTIEKRRADDTGSAIQGYDIDYYVPEATLAMGVDMVAVKILDTE